VNDSEYAGEQECGKEGGKKERAIWLTHGNTPVIEDDQEPRRESIAR
jgi:hypothetical protein